MSASNVRVRFSKANPCPVCRTGKNCSVLDDGLHLCRGEPQGDEFLFISECENGFKCYRRVGENTYSQNGHKGHTNGAAKTAKPKDFAALAKQFAGRITEVERKELSKRLHLPLKALDLIPSLGWTTDQKIQEDGKWVTVPCWTWPEVDANGKILGINRRFIRPVSINGGNPTNKARMGGAKDGLVIPNNFQETTGPVLLVEGESDVMAGAMCGLCCVGRPNNFGGTEHLAELLRGIPKDRAIIVVGENDERDKEGKRIWPGKEGAESTALKLTNKLGRSIPMAFPPDGIKDVRAWVIDQAERSDSEVPWPSIGQEIRENLVKRATSNPTPVASRWPSPVLASALDSEPEKIDWLWNGCIAKGHVTMFSALMKAGKTTLVGHLFRALQDGGQFCGRNTAKCRTLIVSEESKTIWRQRRDALGFDDSLSLLCKPMLAKPTQAEWVDFVLHVKTCAIGHKADLVAIDTISTFAPWKSENDSAEIVATTNPLNHLTKDGFGVLMFHHHGKSDASEGKASRGSSALAGAVDILLDMRRYKPDDLSDRRRVLSGLGRFDEIPDELVIELNADGSGYSAHGDRKAVAAAELNRALFEVLPKEPPGMSAEDVHESLAPKERPNRGTVSKALNTGAVENMWKRSGTGKKGNPCRFWMQVD